MKSTLLARITHTDLAPAPIPTEWIVDGAPVARSSQLSRSLDGTATTSHWDCSAGTFDWQFGCEETVHILEGEVRVRDETGTEFTLSAGDVAVFHAGTTARWHIPRYVRKLAICRHPYPAVVGFAVRAFSKARRLAAKFVPGSPAVRGAPPAGSMPLSLMLLAMG